MKSIKIILMGVFTSLWVGQINAQQEIVITLNVNTGEIQNPNVNDYCDFGQSADISNEDYTIEATVGDTIIWRGVSSTNPDDQVLIESINHQGDQGGRDIFGQNRLPGDANGEVRGTIQFSTEGQEPYKYMLSFRVLNNGEPRAGVFNIDPKIKVGGR